MCDECAEVYSCGKAGWLVVLLSMLPACFPRATDFDVMLLARLPC